MLFTRKRGDYEFESQMALTRTLCRNSCRHFSDCCNSADWRITLAVVGGLVSFIYFIQKQQLDEAKFVNELFVRCNGRYDELNEKMNSLAKGGKAAKDFDAEDRDILFDYFNLCGEEYLFHLKGYIYPEVWKSWVAGMKIFYDKPGIREFWLSELQSQSYYGLNVEEEIRTCYREPTQTKPSKTPI